LKNPVAKNNKHRGGAFKPVDRDAKHYVNKKIRKELDELDEKWIEEEIDNYNKGINEEN